MKINPVAIAIHGVNGRMGQAIISSLPSFQGLDCQVGFARALPDLTQQLTFPIVAYEPHCLKNIKVVIDFSSAKAALTLLEGCIEQNVALVCGTSGFTETEQMVLKNASKQIPILFSTNMSVGANASFYLLRELTKMLPDWEKEIFEVHHRAKKDAPSGTALLMGEAIASTLKKRLSDLAQFDYFSESNPRNKDAIGFSAMRGGDIVGEHAAWFIGNGERIEIHHKAWNRQIYAEGALKAALWIAQQPAGFYSMEDVLFS